MYIQVLEDINTSLNAEKQTGNKLLCDFTVTSSGNGVTLQAVSGQLPQQTDSASDSDLLSAVCIQRDNLG